MAGRLVIPGGKKKVTGSFLFFYACVVRNTINIIPVDDDNETQICGESIDLKQIVCHQQRREDDSLYCCSCVTKLHMHYFMMYFLYEQKTIFIEANKRCS